MVFIPDIRESLRIKGLSGALLVHFGLPLIYDSPPHAQKWQSGTDEKSPLNSNTPCGSSLMFMVLPGTRPDVRTASHCTGPHRFQVSAYLILFCDYHQTTWACAPHGYSRAVAMSTLKHSLLKCSSLSVSFRRTSLCIFRLIPYFL